MSLAVLVFIVGIGVILSARGLSDRYLVGIAGGRLVPTYAFLQSAGHIAGLSIFLMAVPAIDTHRFLYWTCLVFYPVAAISARVVCGLTDYREQFRSHPLRFIIKADRYSAFGGLIGGLAAYGCAVAVFDAPWGMWVTDAFCFGFLAGEIVSRLGCHANGCCYGRPIRYGNRLARVFSAVYSHPLQKVVWHGGFGGQRIHAAALWIAFLNLMLLCLLIVLAARFAPPAGFLGGIGLMLYPFCRVTNEFLRKDRDGMGRRFTYIFLPLLFCWGLFSLVMSLRPGPAPRFLFDPRNLAEKPVALVLGLEYLFLLIVYGAGVEFRRSDLAALNEPVSYAEVAEPR